MKQKLLTILISIICTTFYSQPTLLWSNDFEAGMNYHFSAEPKIKLENDTFVVTGITKSGSAQRLKSVVYNLEGELISAITFESDFSNNLIVDYQTDATNHVYIATQVFLGFYKSKLSLQKYTPAGSLIWTREIHDDAAISYRPHSIGITSGGCIFLSAYKEYNYPEEPTDAIETTTIAYLYAYNPSGDLLWQREFGVPEIDTYFEHELFVYGESIFLFNNNATLIKVDSNNNFTQNNTIGIYDGIKEIQLTPDNNLLIISELKYKYTKVDLTGSSFYLREFGTYLPSNVHGDEIRSFIQDSDGNIYITGRHYGHNYGTQAYTNADILTLKYGPAGNLIWQNRYQYGINNADIGNCITLKNGYVYVGGSSQRLGISTDYDYVALKIDAISGDTNQVYRYNGQANGTDTVSSIVVRENGAFALTGLSYINELYDWTTQFLSPEPLALKEYNNTYTTGISPNPIAPGEFLTINGPRYHSYKLSSSVGQIVQSGTFNNFNSQSIRIGMLNPGIYILQMEDATQKVVRKIIIK